MAKIPTINIFIGEGSVTRKGPPKKGKRSQISKGLKKDKDTNTDKILKALNEIKRSLPTTTHGGGS